MSVADELTKLVALRDSGALTQEEFDQQRAILLPPSPSAALAAAPSKVTQTDSILAPSEPVATARPSMQRRLLAAIVGLGVSVASSFALAMVIPTSPSGVSAIFGVIIGSAVAGKLLGAHTPGAWAAAVGLVFITQLVVGLVIIALLR